MVLFGKNTMSTALLSLCAQHDVTISFLSENGRLTDALTETMISGNFADMLMHIEAISADTVSDGSSVLPYVAFGNVTVSGK